MLNIKRLLGSKTTLIIAVLYSCFITILFFIPTSGLPKVGISNFDKIVHVCIFVGLLLLWQLYFFVRNNYVLPKSFIWILLASSLVYGILIEVFQHTLTKGRSGDVYDVGANFVGALIAVLLFKLVQRLF